MSLMIRTLLRPTLVRWLDSLASKPAGGCPKVTVTGSILSHSRSFQTSSLLSSRPEVSVIFVRTSGEKMEAKGKVGDNLLDIIVANNIDLDGYGACEGTLACSTCHLIFKQGDYDRLPEPASDEELDMLDLAYGLTDTSRLGCQVCMTKELSGMEVQVPEGVLDQRNA